jgi:hypothetical protein
MNVVEMLSLTGVRSVNGFLVVVSPAAPIGLPRISMSQDCDPGGLWCTREFRTQIDTWLVNRFGLQPCLFTMGDRIVVHPSNLPRLQELLKEI